MPSSSLSSIVLTDDEAVTLRRVAFGESEVRSLRRADLDRLTRLKLIVANGSSMLLTSSGRDHLASLPRATFAKPRRGER